VHLRHESRHFASNEELSSPSDTYPDAYGDKPGHGGGGDAISKPGILFVQRGNGPKLHAETPSCYRPDGSNIGEVEMGISACNVGHE
jgi:hypothetical protein